MERQVPFRLLVTLMLNINLRRQQISLLYIVSRCDGCDLHPFDYVATIDKLELLHFYVIDRSSERHISSRKSKIQNPKSRIQNPKSKIQMSAGGNFWLTPLLNFYICLDMIEDPKIEETSGRRFLLPCFLVSKDGISNFTIHFCTWLPPVTFADTLNIRDPFDLNFSPQESRRGLLRHLRRSSLSAPCSFTGSVEFDLPTDARSCPKVAYQRCSLQFPASFNWCPV